MRTVIVDHSDMFGDVRRFIPENATDRELLQGMGIKPFTGEIFHIEGDEIVYETIGEGR